MLTLVISCLLVLLIIIFSAFYYLRFSIHKHTAVFLFIIRCVAILLLMCILFEPVISLNTLKQDKERITILLDVSKSMGLFRTDLLIRKTLADLELPSGKTPPVNILCFGDSLRHVSKNSSISFSDRHSYFPSTATRELSGHDNSIIIISDGNWSNPNLPDDIIKGNYCFYLPLDNFSPEPFLRNECISFQSHIQQDSTCIASMALYGFKKSSQPIEITASEGTKILFTGHINADSGYFSDTATIRFPQAIPGRHCYNIKIQEKPDSLYWQMHYICQVIPGAFKTRIYSAEPTINKRFLSMALADSKEWKIEKTNNGETEALFFLDWNDEAQKEFSRIKPSGIAVFVGCIPQPAQSYIVPDSFGIIALHPDDSFTVHIARMNLPPPALIAVCTPQFTDRILLTCITKNKKTKFQTYDTLPFLFTKTFNNRIALFLTARDIWKMEFLPLSVNRENESSFFLHDIAKIARERLCSNLNRDFFAFPAVPELYEGDSCKFSFVLPLELIEADSRSKNKISFSIFSNSEKLIDTTLIAGNYNSSGIQLFGIRPFKAGTYIYKAVFKTGSSDFVFSDTMRIKKNDMELFISGQNTTLLSQLAIPVDAIELKKIRDAAMAETLKKKMINETSTFQIKQFWPVLVIILMLFVTEWFIRKKIGLDK